MENGVKRRHESDSVMEVDAKRQAVGATVLFRVLVPNDRAGSILGKGGEVIGRLRSETDARIKMEVPLRGSEERVVTIHCTDPNPEAEFCPAQAALFRVHQLLSEGDSDGSASSEGPPPLRLLVDRSQVQALLGKGGRVVQGFREETGAGIKISGDVLPLCALAGEEVVQVSGDFPAAQQALQRISATLRANPNPAHADLATAPPPAGGSGRQVHSGGSGYGGYGGETFEAAFRMLVPTARAGVVIGRNGDEINHLRRETGANVRVREAVEGCEERVVLLSSTDDVTSGYCAAQEASLRVAAQILLDRVQPLRLLVPSAQVGALVGKGGARINALRRDTRAIIKIDPDGALPLCSDKDDRLVQVEARDNPTTLSALRAVTQVLLACQARNQGKLYSLALPPAGMAGMPPGMPVNAHGLPPGLPLGMAALQPGMGMMSAPAAHMGGGHGVMASMGLPMGLGAPMQMQGPGGPMGGNEQIPGVLLGLAAGLRNNMAGSPSSLRIMIPKEQVGAVLGHKGCNINQMRAFSGARVKLHDGGGGAGRELEIQGSMDQLQAAHKLLQSLLTALPGAA